MWTIAQTVLNWYAEVVLVQIKLNNRLQFYIEDKRKKAKE